MNLFGGELLFDPQTSGGLLLSVPTEQAQQLVQALWTAGVIHAKLVGMALARMDMNAQYVSLRVL
jgi:selenophosphate synthase